MKILIASGIYPPDIGGPAQYARNLYETWKEQGHEVKVAAYRWERAVPSPLSNALYLTKVIRKAWKADLILVLDTWNAAVPTMIACAILRKKYIIRTGGDRLWETYIERTGDLVLFKDFYSTRIDAKLSKLSFREKLIYRWGGRALCKAASIIFSTDWQRRIFEKAYGLDPKKNVIVENYCGAREAPVEPENRVFVAGTRTLKWKNIELLKKAFGLAQEKVEAAGLPPIELDCGKAVYDSFLEKIKRSYAVILVSLGDASPGLVFDAVACGVPCILTRENGIKERIGNGVIEVDPLSVEEIAEKIVWLARPENRKRQAEKVQSIGYTHTWEQIAAEVTDVYNDR
jgi:glycosyltransferase involved in cell wall biosynthesis